VAVADGDQALDWLGLCLFDGSLQNVPALIVSDVRLPHFSGLELLEGLLCASAEIPVVLITGFPSEETYAEAFELGAARVLAKPFALDALRLAVQNVLDAPGWTKLPA
jgi:DNA-binding NtrC family response regulator